MRSRVFLIADNDEAERSHIAAQVRDLDAAAVILEAKDALTARRITHERQPDVVILEPALPATPGGPAAPRRYRITLDHRVVATDFPGLAFAREALGAQPNLQFFLVTLLAPDHPDVRALRELGITRILHKSEPQDIQGLGPRLRAADQHRDA